MTIKNFHRLGFQETQPRGNQLQFTPTPAPAGTSWDPDPWSPNSWEQSWTNPDNDIYDDEDD